MTRDVWRAALVALALVSLGIATHGGVPALNQSYLESYPGDSAIYLSMVSHQRMSTRPPAPDDPPWSMSRVRLPFRYRILTPWLARLLPFGPVFSLALVNWASFFGAYVFVLLTCRRLGLGFGASAGGLAVAFTFVSHLPVYFGPWLTDGPVLLILSGMTYAFAIDHFWLFAGFGLVGLFAREVPVVLLPVWCVRDWKRAVAVTALAMAAVIVERAILGDAADALNPHLINSAGLTMTLLRHPAEWPGLIADLVRRGPPGASFWPGVYWPPHHLQRLLVDVGASWGWAFPLVATGLWLLPRDEMRRIGPVLGVLLVAAFGMSLIATDVSREFMVLLPVVVVSIAVVISALAAQRRIVWLTLLGGLAAVQFCLSEPNVVLRQDAWLLWTARVPMIRIGAVWALGAAFFLRADLLQRLTSPGYTLPRRAR